MEILVFLGLDTRRLVALAAMSGMAAAGAGYYASRQQPLYEATATVFVGQARQAGGSAFDIGPLVSDFRTVATWAPVRDEVATGTGVSAAELSIVAEREGEGSSVRLVVTAPTAQAAEQGAQIAGESAMRELSGRQVTRTARIETDKAAAAESASTKLDELNRANGFENPLMRYNDVQREATRLDLAWQDPSLDLTPAERQALETQAAQLRLLLPDLAVKAETFSDATQDLSSARDELLAASRDLSEAKSIEAEATAPGVVTVDAAVAASVLPNMVRAGGAAGLISAGLGVGMVALASRRKTTSVARDQASSRPPGAAPDPDAAPAKATSSELDEVTAATTKPQPTKERVAAPSNGVKADVESKATVRTTTLVLERSPSAGKASATGSNGHVDTSDKVTRPVVTEAKTRSRRPQDERVEKPRAGLVDEQGGQGKKVKTGNRSHSSDQRFNDYRRMQEARRQARRP